MEHGEPERGRRGVDRHVGERDRLDDKGAPHPPQPDPTDCRDPRRGQPEPAEWGDCGEGEEGDAPHPYRAGDLRQAGWARSTRADQRQPVDGVPDREQDECEAPWQVTGRQGTGPGASDRSARPGSSRWRRGVCHATALPDRSGHGGRHPAPTNPKAGPATGCLREPHRMRTMTSPVGLRRGLSRQRTSRHQGPHPTRCSYHPRCGHSAETMSRQRYPPSHTSAAARGGSPSQRSGWRPTRG